VTTLVGFTVVGIACMGQITPRALTAAIVDRDRAAAKRAFDTMMQRGKIDIAAIDAARRG
jgi:predicted 3-demethylubiquinone-9 3-methyltransferase (glyoxalase superfamily)